MLVAGYFPAPLARARTFCFEARYRTAQAMGLIRGGSLENAIVLTNDGVKNGPLRFPMSLGAQGHWT